MDREIIYRFSSALLPNGEFLKDAAITCLDSQIINVEKFNPKSVASQENICDLRELTAIPGLINAHTHLEYTDFLGQIDNTNDFIKWIKQIIILKNKTTYEQFIESSKKGIDLCVKSGTTTVVDIASTDASIEPLMNAPIRKFICPEIISLDPKNAENIFNNFLKRIEKIKKDDLIQIGLSPHAPYTVSPDLYKLCTQYARDNKTLLTTHLCETKEEIEFLAQDNSKMENFLREINALPNKWKSPKLSPIEYLYSNNILNKNSLLVHLNYPSDKDIEIVQKSGASVVYCPKSHKYFEHDKYPLIKLLNAGVNVCIGTDSLASNDTLDILAELRAIKQEFKELNSKQILDLATINSAIALNYKHKLGRIEKNYFCDLTLIRNRDNKDITIDAIVEDESITHDGIIIAGRFIS